MKKNRELIIFVFVIIFLLGALGIQQKDSLIYSGSGQHITLNLEDNNIETNKKVENTVNINTATKDELMQLEGIGDKTADNIIEYRNKHKFKTVDEIKNVSGVGDKKFQTISQYIKVDDEG